MDIKKIFEKYFKGNSKKVFTNMIILLLVGVLLILIGDITAALNSKKTKKAQDTVQVSTTEAVASSSSQYEDKIRKELADTLSLISGVGRVEVMIYFDSGSEQIPATNINDSNQKIDEKDNQGGTRVTNEVSRNVTVVLVNEDGTSKPFVIKQLNPAIGGVMVVAEGASNPDIKEKVQSAVKTVLNIPSYKVSVLPMRKGN